MNSISIIKKDNQSVSRWSGGTTTQLYIYPENCEYSNRDFIFRLSSALVEDEKSTFTSLVDYKRLLMVLEGHIDLVHDDKEHISLNKFEQNYFDGSSKTNSTGIVTDFNLMMRKDRCDGEIKVFTISNLSSIKIGALNRLDGYNSILRAIYAYDSDTKVIVDNKSYDLDKKDILLINTNDNNENINITIQNKENSENNIIYSEIKCK